MVDNWRKELLESDKTLTELQKEILRNGAKSLSQSWIMSSLKKRSESTSK